MPATPSRIGFITQEYRRATSETAAAATRHGKLARESEDPIETFFDDVEDAQVMADARQTLLSSERRRFAPRVVGMDEALALTYLSGTIPLGHYTDTERSADMSVLVAEIGFDFARQQCEFTVWG